MSWEWEDKHEKIFEKTPLNRELLFKIYKNSENSTISKYANLLKTGPKTLTDTTWMKIYKEWISI